MTFGDPHLPTTPKPSTEPLSTILAVLERRAEAHPVRRAFSFLWDEQRSPATLSFGELIERAKSTGVLLRREARPGSRVLLFYPTGPEYIIAFIGCLFGGLIAVPLYPPGGNRRLFRLNKIIGDCKPVLALTSAELLPRIQKLFSNEENTAAVGLRQTPESAELPTEACRDAAPSDDDPAYLQYTSGSTGNPKGVLITHGNLMANLKAMAGMVRGETPRVFLNWLPLYHDMGLVNTVLHPLFGGHHSLLMPATAFIRDPLSWLRQITRYKAQICGGPNFAYDLCASRASAEQVGEMDLSSWEIAYNGAETIGAETLARFNEVFQPAGFRPESFYPCYGMAESTLMVTGGAATARPEIGEFDRAGLEAGRAQPAVAGARSQSMVGCGRSVPGHRIAIADPRTRASLPDGRVGEIWISGPSIAAGYWNRPEETNEVFHGYLAGSGEGPFLRSGDLGFLREGELFVTGRLKDLIIVRGRNHHPADIEETAARSAAHLSAGRSAAFALETGRGPRLVLVQEVPRTLANRLDFDRTAGLLRRAVSEQHALRLDTVAFVTQGGIPKTTSGKIRRGECRALFENGGLATLRVDRLLDPEPCPVPPKLADLAGASPARVRTALEEYVAGLLNLKREELDGAKPLVSFGLDSIGATELHHRLELGAGLKMSPSRLLEGLSLNDLTREIAALPEGRYPVEPEASTSGPEPETLPLSYNQRALWFLYRVAPSSSAYHLSFALQSRKPLDRSLLERCFHLLAERHPVFRVVYDETRGRPFQRVAPERLPFLFEIRATAWSDARLKERLDQEAHRPFDLKREPPIRILLFRRPDRRWVLLWTVHHIAIDYWSVLILIDEWRRLAENEADPAMLAATADRHGTHVSDQETMLAGEKGARLARFWENRLAGPLPYLDLPTDRPRSPSQTDRGALYRFGLNPTSTCGLRSLARKGDTTLYTVLLAGFFGMLHRYSGQEDVLVGSPCAGRSDPRFKDLVGYLVNPLVMRGDLSGRPGFRSLIEKTRRTVLAALAHQDFPFQLLVERLKPERSLNRSPLFQVMFAMYKAKRLEPAESLIFMEGGKEWTVGPFHFDTLAIEKRSAQFELSLIAIETEEGLSCGLEYNTDLFTVKTVAGFARRFQRFLAVLTEDPECPVTAVPLMDKREQRRLLEAYANPADYPTGRCIHELFWERAEKRPGAEAVGFGGEILTYGELASRVAELAGRLRDRGVRRGDLVGICMTRSFEMVTGLLAILHAGGAYVPLDPSYPRHRLELIVEDAGISVTLTHKTLATRLGAALPQPLLADEETPGDTGRTASVGATPEDPIYVIYTSGSTGRPKGAILSHRSVFNRIWWMQTRFPLDRTDAVLQKTPFGFDVSVWEFFWPLAMGARLVVAPPEAHRDPAELSDIIEEWSITTIHFVPSMLRAFLEEGRMDRCASLKRVFSSGESLSPDLPARFFATLSAELHNLYGPTEAAIDVTAWQCKSSVTESSIPIGYPIANIQALVLDREMNLLPPGISGELYLGGTGLARGYCHRPAQTAISFLPNRFERIPGTRLYKTGDAARYLTAEDTEYGPIEFLGRLDAQVKLRGHRIETGEIEVFLNRHDQVREAVVLASEFHPGDTRLTAFVAADPANPPTADALHGFLEKFLPEPMIPGAFHVIEELPRNPNGKLDRRSLQEKVPSTRQHGQHGADRELVPPRTPIEKEIAGIWREVLGLDRIGVSDNFFRLGGHSLLGIQAVSRLNETFKIELSVHYLFEQPTIAALAEYIESTRWVTEPSQPADTGEVVYESGEV